MVRIVVIDGYTLNPGDNSWAPLEEHGTLTVYDRTPPARVTEVAKCADIIVTNKCPLSAHAIKSLPMLKFIAVTATGHNIVDGIAARRRGVPVSNVPEYGTQTVAQFTWALTLELCHWVGRHDESVKLGQWTKSPDFCYWLKPQIELAGKRLGLVGYGRIARCVAQIGTAFGMKVVASGRSDAPALKLMPPGKWLNTEEVFETADVISLHCPLTPNTDRMVNGELLERMKRAALLVNTSRGGLINEQDLADALTGARIAALRWTSLRLSQSSYKTHCLRLQTALLRRILPGRVLPLDSDSCKLLHAIWPHFSLASR